jgi:large subunit ribosomal protein L23
MVLIKPLITEKALAEAAKKRYTFKVNLAATKPEIKRAVEKTFGVKVTAVQTAINHGKQYRTGKRWFVRKKADWKKAVVTIQPDKQIDLFEVTETTK